MYDPARNYADQRYYSPGTGRFLSADPYMASGGAANPSSWNRYAYVEGDPVNRYDPRGLDYEPPDPPWPARTYVRQLSQFERARDALKESADRLQNRSAFSEECVKGLGKLGIDPAQLTAAAADVDIQDGFRASIPISNLGVGEAEAFGRALQAQRDAEFGPQFAEAGFEHWTIAMEFQYKPGHNCYDTAWGE
jgi:RHS repeat-associated protein